MTLIKSISGTRGTIGGKIGDNLTPIDIVESAAAYGKMLSLRDAPKKIVLGRDGRITGKVVSDLVANTLMMQGYDIVDLGLSTTPTVEIAVPLEEAGGGIIITASHNPKEWNALKFLNQKGEFISAEDGAEILQIQREKNVSFAPVEELGLYTKRDDYIDIHIHQILDLDIVDVDLIKEKNFTVVVDCINSTGAIAIPPLLDKLNVSYSLLNKEITGEFAHNPEPLPAHLTQLSAFVKSNEANMGISVDPDVDRLALVCENGEMFGEEYTLVAVADYILSKTPGATVSNLSSTRALADVARSHGGSYQASAVGEVNVVSMMKETNAVIGGEGNGGIIYPALHYGRDALVGIAIMLNHLAEQNVPLSELRAGYPHYEMIKNKIQLTPETDVSAILEHLREQFKDERINTIDGVKIDFEEGWVHLRKSNTEPIIRVYSEAGTSEMAEALVQKIMNSLP